MMMMMMMVLIAEHIPVQISSDAAWLQLYGFVAAHYAFAEPAFHTIIRCSTQKGL